MYLDLPYPLSQSASRPAWYIGGSAEHFTAHEDFTHPLTLRRQKPRLGTIKECLMGPGIRYPTGRGHSVDLKLSHETICRLICVHLQGEE